MDDKRGNTISKEVEGKLEETQELLPGISDELTIARIAPKLPWTAFPVLAAVSRGWRRAVRSRRVYNARVLSKSSQTLVALIHYKDDVNDRISLYSIEENTYDHLPPIPGVEGGIPRACGCISLDGKLYILGGSREVRRSAREARETREQWHPSPVGVPARANVYVFDVAGERQWKQLSNMEHPRELFGCAPLDGKIYIFGGSSDSSPVYGSELYDPKTDSWSPITPAPSLWFSHKVAVMGGELVLHSGSFYDSEFFGGNRIIDFNDVLSGHVQRAISAEVYSPLKNEWRILERFTVNRDTPDVVVSVGGRFVNLKYSGIQVYETHANSWEPPIPPIHAWRPTYRIRKPNVCFTVFALPLAAVALDDEVLALVTWDKSNEPGEISRGAYLIRSHGVAGEVEEIEWEKVPFRVGFSIMCPIHL